MEIARRGLQNRRIWVTGASSGIGRALAIELSKAGARLIVSGQNRERLEEVAAACGGDVMVLPFDASDRAATQAAAGCIDTRFGALDTVVLNAGICEYIDLPDFDAASIKRVMDVNFMGVVYGVEASLPLLRKGVTPHLAGMSSTVAYTGLPRAEAYGSSKAAIRHLLQALRVDLFAEKIDISIICPGFVQTPLTDQNDFPMPMRITAGESARCIRRGLERRFHEIRYPFFFALMLRTLAMLPSRLRTRLLVSMSPNRPGKASKRGGV
jgi:NAD(P)-dependent dehydrogenase (short-subunit alcohol dehydrogenase family)